MREQKSGYIRMVSSIGGVVAFPNIGLYHASKWALEGSSEALTQEVAPFGISITLVEPGGYTTDWAGSSAKHAPALPAYAGLPLAQKAFADRLKVWESWADVSTAAMGAN